jgi:hypothetical protein
MSSREKNLPKCYPIRVFLVIIKKHDFCRGKRVENAWKTRGKRVENARKTHGKVQINLAHFFPIFCRMKRETG